MGHLKPEVHKTGPWKREGLFCTNRLEILRVREVGL
jgi:hypothetical protein